jgi:hypothetical protein
MFCRFILGNVISHATVQVNQTVSTYLNNRDYKIILT